MTEIMESYAITVWTMGAMGGLLLLQILVVDAISILRHHAPGTPVASDHADALFRATRAHANTNESIAAFLLLALFGMFSGADPGWLNAMACLFVVSRLAHMLFYYANLKMLRSVVFAIALLALLGMFAVSVAVWL